MVLSLLLAIQVSVPAPPVVPIAIVNNPRLVSESTLGKAASARMDALRKEKEKAIADKRVAIQGMTQKNAPPADIERAQVDLQRMAQDADSDVKALNDQLQREFARKVGPILKQILEEDHIGVILEFPNPQLILWVDPSVDITTKVIQRLDTAEKAGK
jgi:Skp family chaperone for outer membrane proteins